ncbi:hypothetical protein ACQR1I_32315 [Bradyrhizobium sp. HKCCYLS2038]|uniref:hypothetical protein n=1 Tax=unclassified Bradyrhizobium TaxID=2631580 RepID=UPI003EBD99EB
MRTSTAFFAGVGTVSIAVAAGLGGGLMIAEGMHPRSPAADTAKLERSLPEQPSPSPTVTSYLAATQAAATTPIKVAPAAAQSAATTPTPAASSSPPQAVPAETTVTATAPAQSDINVQAGATDDAQAKVADKAQDKSAEKAQESTESKARDAERKRVAEQRRAERHRQYAERRRQRREQDLRAVEQAVREDSTPRAYAAQPVGMDGPRFSFFGDD